MNIIYLIDFNCPYSYIGLKRLQKAVKNLDLDTEWEIKSFELESLTGKASISARERYAQKYNITESEALERLEEIEDIALEDGLKINFKDMICEIHSPNEANKIYNRLVNETTFPIGVLFDWKNI